MFRPYMVSFTQISCANAEKMIAEFVASVGNRNKVARALRKPAAYMVSAFFVKLRCKFLLRDVADWLLKMQPRFGLFWPVFGLFQKTLKNEKKLCSQILFFARVFKNLW